MNDNATQGATEQGATEEVERPSLAGMLRVTAELVDRTGWEPVVVQVSREHGVDLEVSTHDDLNRWVDLLGLVIAPYSSQPFIWNGILHKLTNVRGPLGGVNSARINVCCCEPVDVASAPREAGGTRG